MNEELLKQMLLEIKGVRKELESINLKIDRYDYEINELEQYKAEVNKKFEKLTETTEFLTHKVVNNDREVFTLKRKLL